MQKNLLKRVLGGAFAAGLVSLVPLASARATEITLSPILAQGEDAAAAAAGGMLGLLCNLAIVAVSIGILVWIILTLKGCLEAIPPQYREVEPGMVWLLIIPCVNIIGNFLVFPKIGKSFANYFNANGRTDVEDGGEQLGLFYAIASILCGPVALILLIMLLMKWTGYKKEIPENAA